MTVDGTAGGGTATKAPDRRIRSVRDRPATLGGFETSAARAGGPALAVAALTLLAFLVLGLRAIGVDWVGGDLLYHQALAREILRGTLPLEGPYAGLPTYYPPGFHALLAGTVALTGFEAVPAISLLTALWMPVLPIGTFLLARRLTGRPWVAVVAVALTLFAGGLDLRAGRLWVNSLFLSGQQAWPLYPRDLVFGLLPFGVLAFVIALGRARPSGAVAWAAVAGLVFGIAGLIQVQLLLPVPCVLLGAAAVAARERGAPVPAAVLVTTGVAATVLVTPWLLDQVGAIARNGGVALDSNDLLEPARFGIWQYPRQFGLVLPLATIGAGVALLFLRRRDGPRPDGKPGAWRGDPPSAAALVAWAVVPFAIAILYSPDLPLEDALRPQRMWLLASQPIAILAAIGLVTIAEHVRAGRHLPRRVVPVAVALMVLVAAAPSTLVTARLLAETWTRPTYGHLDLAGDRVPNFRPLVGAAGRRTTVLTYEDWSSLVWYETGQAVVGVLPAGYAKLAFDPAWFTAFSQDERRALLLEAFAGNRSGLEAAIARARPDAIVIGRSADGRTALFDAAAVPASRLPGAVRGNAAPIEGNGWDGLLMTPGSELVLATRMPPGATRLDVRLADHPELGDAWALRLIARAPSGDTELARLGATPEADGFTVVGADVAWPGDADLVLAADDPILVQSVRGFGPAQPPPAGWAVAVETPEAIVLRPVG